MESEAFQLELIGGGTDVQCRRSANKVTPSEFKPQTVKMETEKHENSRKWFKTCCMLFRFAGAEQIMEKDKEHTSTYLLGACNKTQLLERNRVEISLRERARDSFHVKDRCCCVMLSVGFKCVVW